MGKFEAWREAKQAQHQAREDYSNSAGGSTKDRYLGTLDNLKRADDEEARTWNELSEE